MLEQLHGMGFESRNVFSRNGLLNLTWSEGRGDPNLTEESDEEAAIKKLTPDQWYVPFLFRDA